MLTASRITPAFHLTMTNRPYSLPYIWTTPLTTLVGILLKMIRNCEFYRILYLTTCVRQTKFSGTRWIKNFNLNDLTDRTRNRTCSNFSLFWTATAPAPAPNLIFWSAPAPAPTFHFWTAPAPAPAPIFPFWTAPAPAPAPAPHFQYQTAPATAPFCLLQARTRTQNRTHFKLNRTRNRNHF